MRRINVLVAVTSPDVMASGIAQSVADRHDMHLVEGRVVPADQIAASLEGLPSVPQCALVLVGHPPDTAELARRWLAERDDLVVVVVDLVDAQVRIALRDPFLDALLATLRNLVERAGRRGDRIARLEVGRSSGPDATVRPLLRAASDWIHALLQDAVERVHEGNGDMPGFSVTRATLLQSLDDTLQGPPDDRTLVDARNAGEAAGDPLAIAARAFGLGDFEFQLLVLALAPELDLRFQRCIGFLLDNMSRRVGTATLYGSLLGVTPRTRDRAIQSGALAHWRVFDPGDQPVSPELPLALDPFLTQWMLGADDALADDPRVRRTLRLEPWPGWRLLQRREEEIAADRLLERLARTNGPWILLGGDDRASWRALLELGAKQKGARLLRIECARLLGADPAEVEQSGRRLARLVLLTGARPVLDVPDASGAESDEETLHALIAALTAARCPVAVVGEDESRLIRLLGAVPGEVVEGPPFPEAGRSVAFKEAAIRADAYLTDDEAAGMAHRYPLGVDRLDQAMRLALARPLDFGEDNPRLARFTAACRQVAGLGVSHLVDRIDPIFDLDDVVLPSDRKQQLVEIVDHVRLAGRVLDEWKFRDQLPYGRGVTALFFGPSGTGKTMAAMGIARRLGVQLLRLDFSRVVSKYIGDTEKNIDRVFTDAQRSGAAILIDEADALLGKRSEVKDAHDRYANIEVAYLLQRMEQYDGLAVLTTNMRQNLDSAFLRRLRFILDFPRPDVEARQQIWRFCLPAGSHALDDAAFAHLARKIDLTGGHIRQITLRAAFLAASAGTLIGLEHIAQAARAELAKLGMPPVELDPAPGRRAA